MTSKISNLSLSERMILAVSVKGLPPELQSSGFIPLDANATLSAFNSSGLWLGPRSALEEMPEFRQIIPYVVLRVGSKLVRYTRMPSGGENRLHGRTSIGLGGHIDLSDVNIVNNSIDLEKTISVCNQREIFEELGSVTCVNVQWLGVLIDNSNEVGKVHIGIVELWDVESLPFVAPEDSIGDVSLCSIDELRLGRENLETWSEMLLKHF
jgi:predicted NUDIX family phosphoesterase